MKKRMIALLLCLTLALGMAACTKPDDQVDNTNTPDPTPSETIGTEPGPDATPNVTPETTPDVEPTPDVVDSVPIRFAVLSGPTGVGAAKLLADNEAGESSNAYEVTVATDNQEIATKLTNGDLDIACMASNVAANLYNKTGGDVQALCLSTLGVLYILERGEKGFTATVNEMSDLKGETIYATGQGANPEYVLDYLLTANGLDPDKDVEIIWQTPAEVQTALLTGKAKYAMLPVPAATAVQVQAKKSNDCDVLSVLDLTEEWDRVTDFSVLTMTTVVVRTEFAQEHPQLVEMFLDEYRGSIEFVNENVEEAAKMVVQFGIVPAEPIAKLAIPDCNLVYVTGEQMRDQIQGYYQVLYQANPDSIGGGIPDDAFYYGT